MTLLKTDPLREVSHAQVLEDNPDWALVIGLGYDRVQKKGLVYKHIHKLLESLRSITHGDPMKAKALSEMLYLRTHAGVSVHKCCCYTKECCHACTPLLHTPQESIVCKTMCAKSESITEM